MKHIATLLLFPTLAFGQGFIETPDTAQARGPMANVSAFMVERGPFTFPAPYNTTGFRLTNASDCGGQNCVADVGYAYWRAINAHEGEPELKVLVGLRRTRGGPGPSIVTIDKATESVSAPVPLFDPSDGRSWQETETWYWSGSDPDLLYYPYERGLYRVDARTGEGSTVINVQDKLSGDFKLWQAHTSDDDKVHSFTLRTGNYSNLGCAVYFEETGELRRFNAINGFDECQVDASGEWLLIMENFDRQAGLDNRVVNLVSGEEKRLIDQDGAGGHLDTGHGYMIAADNWASQANTIRLWRFADMTSTTVYDGGSWNAIAANHISHTNAKPGDPSGQYACGSSANGSARHSNEIICFRLDGSRETLVVAPVMTNRSAGGGDSYQLWPKGNLDTSGRWFVWSSNIGTNRLDVFLVKVPAEKLGADPIEPPPVDPPPVNPPVDPKPCPDCPACPDPEPCPSCPPPVVCPPPIACPAPTLADVLTPEQAHELERLLRQVRSYGSGNRRTILREIEAMAKDAGDE